MLNFQYKGIAQGKYVEGEIEAINNSEAAYKLKEQKIIITKLIKAKKKNVVEKKKKSAGFSFGSGVKTKEILKSNKKKERFLTRKNTNMEN